MEGSTNPFENAVVLTVAGGLRPQDTIGRYDEAAFNHPTHAVEDHDGNIIVSDTLNHKVKRITPAYEVELLAGSSAGCMDGDPSLAKFSEPTYMAIADDNSVYVSDRMEDVVRRIVAGKRVETAAGTSETPYLEMGRDYVFTIDHRGRIDYTPEEWKSAWANFEFGFLDGPRTVARFRLPAGLAFTGAGDLLIVDTGNRAIRILDREGQVGTLAGARTKAQRQEWTSQDGDSQVARFMRPVAVCPDENGAFLITEKTHPGIRRIAATGQVTTLFRDESGRSENGPLGDPAGIVCDGRGNTYVACGERNRVACLTAQGEWYFLGDTKPGYCDGVAQEVRFSRPLGLSLDRSGNLLVADSGNHAVRRVLVNPPAGLLSRLHTQTGSAERVLYEAEAPEARVRKVRTLAISSWQAMLGRRITFAEKAPVDDVMTLHFDGFVARVRGIGDDPTPYFANDHQGDMFHLYPDHVVGQTIHGLRLHFTSRSVENDSVEFIKLQFADGGFQYLQPNFGDGLELEASVPDATLLPEAKAISQTVRSVERPRKDEIALVLDKGVLIVRSLDGEEIEILSCDSCRDTMDVLNERDEAPNPFLVAKGLDEEKNEFVFSIAVPAPGDVWDSERSEALTAPLLWNPIDPLSVVGQSIQEEDIPLALPNDPIGGYVMLTLTDFIVLLQVKKGAGLTTCYVPSP